MRGDAAGRVMQCGSVAVAHLQRRVAVVEFVGEKRGTRASFASEGEVGEGASELASAVEEEGADEGEEEKAASEGAAENSVASFVVRARARAGVCGKVRRDQRGGREHPTIRRIDYCGCDSCLE